MIRVVPQSKNLMFVISKDGSKKSKKSPKKTFVETDMYTIKLPDGTRDLVIEDTLSHIETTFSRIIKHTINKRVSLSSEERAQLCIFTAAMSVRTKSQKDNFGKTFRELHEMVEDMEKFHKAPPSTSLETKVLRDYAHQITIKEMLEMMPPILYRMSLVILVTDDATGFITSDEPCVWFNPDLYKYPPLYRHPGLGQPKIEVTLPLTPKYLLIFSWYNLNGYLPVKEHHVDEFNRRTRGLCDEYFVSRKSETKPIWFDMGIMPEDAWEKTHPMKEDS